MNPETPCAIISRNSILAGGALLLSLLAGTAQGQTALGDGTGLQVKLGRQDVPEPPRRNFRAEVQMRNDIVTGNAVGGRAFRGDVGYTSGDDFRGNLGSDDLFRFRRDSLGTGAAGLGLRGTNSLQYQYSLSTGNQFSAYGSAGALSRLGGPLDRSKVDFTSVPRIPRRVSTDTTNSLGEGWNVLSPKMNTLRSTSSFSSTQSLNASVVGAQQLRDGTMQSLVASSLMGIRAVVEPRFDNSLNTRVNTSVTGDGNPFETSPAPGVKSSEPRVDTAYSGLIDRLSKFEGGRKTDDKIDDKTKGDSKTPGSTPANTPDGAQLDGGVGGKPAADAGAPLWESRLSKLRAQIESDRTMREQAIAKRSDQVKNGGAAAVDKRKQDASGATTTLSRKGDDKKPDGDFLDSSRTLADFDLETIRMIREAGGIVNTYATSTLEKDLYSGYMAEGGKALGLGRYFDAEEQFARALSISPGDPTASAARINAQIGGSLFLSAAVNLEALLEKHPEMAAMRFEGSTIANPKRLATVAEYFREKIQKAKDRAQLPPRESALLLAYVGYQLGDASMTAEGMNDLVASEDAGSPSAFVQFLRGVWLAQPAK